MSADVSEDSCTFIFTVKQRPVAPIVVWCFLRGACVLIYIFVSKEKKFSWYRENIESHRTKFSRLGDEAPGICAPLNQSYFTDESGQNVFLF